MMGIQSPWRWKSLAGLANCAWAGSLEIPQDRSPCSPTGHRLQVLPEKPGQALGTISTVLYASRSSDWNWETRVDIQTFSPNMSATLGITSQSLHFQIGKMDIINPVQQCSDELNHVKAPQMEKTKCLLSAHLLLDHVDYTQSFKYWGGWFRIRKFDLGWQPLSIFMIELLSFFLICIHVFPMGRFFTMFSSKSSTPDDVYSDLCCFTYKHIIYLLKPYIQQPTCLWASFILTDLWALMRHLDLPPSFHEHLRTNLAWLCLHNLGPSAHKVFLLHHKGSSFCLLLPNLLNSRPSLSVFIAQPCPPDISSHKLTLSDLRHPLSSYGLLQPLRVGKQQAPSFARSQTNCTSHVPVQGHSAACWALGCSSH